MSTPTGVASPTKSVKRIPVTKTTFTTPAAKNEDQVKDDDNAEKLAAQLFTSIPLEVVSTIRTWKVKNGVVLRSSQMQATSRMHRFKVFQQMILILFFKPAVGLEKAFDWILSHKSSDLDASLVFGTPKKSKKPILQNNHLFIN